MVVSWLGRGDEPLAHVAETPGCVARRFSALSPMWKVNALLAELDVSRLVAFSRTNISALERLLVGVRGSLRRLKIGLLSFRVAKAGRKYFVSFPDAPYAYGGRKVNGIEKDDDCGARHSMRGGRDGFAVDGGERWGAM